MTKFEGCYLTNAGLEMVHSTGLGNITFTRAETGDGTHTSKEDIPEMTRLKAKRQDFGFDSLTKGANYTVNVKFTIRNKGLTVGYQLSEIGIYAKGDDGEEKLYCVAFALPGNTEEVPPDDDGSIAYVTSVNIETVVSTDCEVTIIYSEDHEWTINYVGDIVEELLISTKNYSDEMYQQATKYTDQAIKNLTFTKSDVGLENVDNTADVDKPVSTLVQQALDLYYQQATAFTLQKIADLINGAPTTLDTLGEIAKAMEEHESVVEALEEAIGKKANQNEMDSLLNSKLDRTGDAANAIVTFSQAATRANIKSKETMEVIMGKIAKFFADLKTVAFTGLYADLTGTPTEATRSSSGLFSAADKTKLDGIAEGANKYTHPTTAGNKHIPSGGKSEQILKYGGASGTAEWGDLPEIPSKAEDIGAVNKEGDTLTGNLLFNMYGLTESLFEIYGGSSLGWGVKIGGDGRTIIGGGEAPKKLSSGEYKDTPNTEELDLCADTLIRFLVNCNNIDERKEFVLNSYGYFYPLVNGTGQIGHASYCWNRIYANTLYGELEGNAKTATVLNHIHRNSGEFSLSDSEYLIPGDYTFGSGCTILDIPVGVNGRMEVREIISGRVIQIWHRTGTVGSNDHYAYKRTVSYSNGVATNVGKWFGFIMFDPETMTNNRAAYYANGQLRCSDVTDTQLNYLINARSNIQVQLDALSNRIDALSARVDAVNKDLPVKINTSPGRVDIDDSIRS